jgi:hypothetical protein
LGDWPDFKPVHGAVAAAVIKRAAAQAGALDGFSANENDAAASSLDPDVYGFTASAGGYSCRCGPDAFATAPSRYA